MLGSDEPAHVKVAIEPLGSKYVYIYNIIVVKQKRVRGRRSYRCAAVEVVAADMAASTPVEPVEPVEPVSRYDMNKIYEDLRTCARLKDKVVP